ncbi:MAG: hypothetical protein ACE5OR_08750 [bacterium]
MGQERGIESAATEDWTCEEVVEVAAPSIARKFKTEEIMKRKFNRKLCVPDGKGGWKLRVYHRSGTGKMSPRYLFKCGDCDERLEVYYDEEFLEIGGVNASIEEWQSYLLPLLKAVPEKSEKR